MYRAVPLAYAGPESAFSGEGSRRFDGRWNPPGLVAVYASLAPEHALLERLAMARRRKAPDREVLPTAVVSAEVDVEAMISWGELPGGTRSRIDPDDVATTLDWTAANGRGVCAPGQAFGQLASRSRVEALLVPSAVVPGALVAVLFLDRFRGPGRLRPQDTP